MNATRPTHLPVGARYHHDCKGRGCPTCSGTGIAPSVHLDAYLAGQQAER